MADTQQLTQEELQFFQNLSNDYTSIRTQLGNILLEIDRLEGIQAQLKETNVQLTSKEREFVDQLQEKYGPGSIDLSKGIYIPAEQPLEVEATEA